MNQEKIGKLISKERKNKNLTQQELADRLNISEKTVSKWECGKGLPEVSLMQPLCKELNISVNELLNGTKDKEEDKVIIEYINYEKKKSKKKIITLTIVSILLITFILSTVIYFFNSYNKIAIYELFGESKNFTYNNGILTQSNIYNILVKGTILPKNDEISKEDITGYVLKCGNIVIEGASGKNSLNQMTPPIIEKTGYNEIISSYKLENLDKWTITITYKYKGDIQQEIIKIKNKVIMKNNEFISIKTDSISKENQEKEERQKDKELSIKIEEDRKYYTSLLKEEGYKPTEDNKYKLKKEITKNEYLIFNTDTLVLEYYKIKNEKNFTTMKAKVVLIENNGYLYPLKEISILGLKNGKSFSYSYLPYHGSYAISEGKVLQEDRHIITSSYLKYYEIIEQIIYS